eukprot:3162670-Pleurochrysis_carterae.AAC.1
MHHHYCANDEKTAFSASDPGGPGTSLCASCACLLSNDGSEAKPNEQGGYEAGKETESAAVPPEAVPQGEESCEAVDAIQAPYHAVGDAAKPVELPVSEAVADAGVY